MGLHWSGEITLGNLITAISLIVWAIAFYYNTNWRLKVIEEWKREHQNVSEAGLKGLAGLSEAIVGLKQIALGQERRIAMLEDRQ